MSKPGKGRVKTSEYRAWRIEAGWMLKMAKQQPISGPVSISYEIEDKGRADLGNLEKAITDLLVSHGMIEGDNREVVRRIAMEWAQVEGVRVTVQSTNR
jgi:crossover junction endodeoxyribonuclease RusA